MNKALLLGGLGAAFLFLNKKPTKNIEIKQEPKDKPEVQEKEIKQYLSLFPSRRTIIDQELNKLPLSFVLNLNIPPLLPSLDYSLWSKNGTTGLYQDWLTTMLYIQIAVVENKWDAFDGQLPLMLECGKRLTVIQLDPPVYDIEQFQETAADCDKRLLQGRVLWYDIRKYVADMLKACPQGAKCQ
jgi:hypothetical protein